MIAEATSSTKIIFNVVKELLDVIIINNPVRLLGVRVSNLFDGNESQLSIFTIDENKKNNSIDQTLDNIKNKYVFRCIIRASEIK